MRSPTFFAAVLLVAVAAAPVTAQGGAEFPDDQQAPASDTLSSQAGPRILVQSLAPEPARSREPQWLSAFEQERARAEVNRPRWVFPVAGAVIGGAAGLLYHRSTQSNSDFMGPVDPVYILAGLGAAAGGLTGWYVDAAQRQWRRTRPEGDEGSTQP